MFEVGFIEPVGFLPLRRDVLAAAVLLAGGLLLACVGVARRAGLACLAVCVSSAAMVRDLPRRPPSVGEFRLEPKAARTVANASSNESWRVSSVTFMHCSWAGSGDDVNRNVRPEVDVATLTLSVRSNWNRRFPDKRSDCHAE